MSADPTPDLSEFAEFADALRGRRAYNERVVRLALERVGASDPQSAGELLEFSQAFEGSLRDLDHAAEELRMQNEALFAARVELEGSSALFRDLFEFAPLPYLVTTLDTRIIYANDAACGLLQRAKNALAGKPLLCFVPLNERGAFRAALSRTTEASEVTTWPATLVPSATKTKVACRVRVRCAPMSGTRIPHALYWNIMEETDEDFF